MLIAIAVAVLAFAPQSDDERLKKLEDRVQKQQEEIDALKKTRKKEGEVTGSLADGLRFKNEEGSIDIRVGGRFVEHYRSTFNRPDSTRTTPDTFFVRAARLKMDGTFFSEFGFQVELDIPSSATGPSPTLQTGFVEWKPSPEFRFMAGQFKAPMSQERLRTRLFSDFVEDDMLTRFVPGYDIGLQAYGLFGEGFFGYQLALIDGRSHLDNAGRSRNDDNDTKEGVGRLTLSPWVKEKESFLKGLRFGVSGSITRTTNVPITATGAAASPTNFDLITPELAVTIFDPANTAVPVLFDGRRSRLQGEISWAIGPVCLRGEYLLRRDEVVGAGRKESVPTTAWYGTATWILTGEAKSPETRITPKESFDLAGGWGAVELAARVAGSRTGQDPLQDVGISFVGQSTEVTSYSGGVNWWLTRNVRFSADVIREDYHGKIALGAVQKGALTGFLARFQIDF